MTKTYKTRHQLFLPQDLSRRLLAGSSPPPSNGRSSMTKTYKTRHQLFLPQDLSRRLAHLAQSSGRARSEILVEALDAWFTRRAAPKTDEALGARLARIERNLYWLRRNEGLVWEIMA
ncbi:ribbon-helix-helix domain-containing protein, partial [Novosphingobium sp. 1949]